MHCLCKNLQTCLPTSRRPRKSYFIKHARINLLLTLQACGISSTALRWFRIFLYDRQQRVVVNNKSSSFFTCNKGVLQGSVLGPMLFNIYVAEFSPFVREHGAKMPSFADDMTLYCSHTSAALACSTVSAALTDILLVPSRSEVSRSMFPKRLPWSLPHTPEHAKVSQRACGFCCRMMKLNSFRKMTAFPSHLTWIQSARKSAEKLVVYVTRTGN